MAIDQLTIENFKGLGDKTDISIKPITLFIGANSSGKSSCIHALACLSQTLKITNNTRPLILDDDLAYVHLGRFIEVVHSKSYQDIISLGVSIKNITYLTHSGVDDDALSTKRGEGSFNYAFKSTKRTQDINLVSATIQAGDIKFSIKKEGSQFHISDGKGQEKCPIELGSGFTVTPESFFKAQSNVENISRFMPLFQIQTHLVKELSNTYYLGPFRQPPQRRYATRGSSPVEVGPMGESTITLLANETVQSQSRKHKDQIAEWLEHLNLAKGIDVARVASSDLFDINITLKDNKTFSIADLGYGLSQVLPVLTQCSFAPSKSTLLFEQPEIHLHSLSARKLSKVFIDTVKEKKCHIVIETHSPELIKQFIQDTQSGKLKKDELVIYRVTREDGKSRVKEIEIDENFDVYDNWEKGISIP
jgi:predicted ATPase